MGISQSWLILAGSTDPPNNINAQKEEDFGGDSKEDGNYLSQIVKNMQIVEQSLQFKDKSKLYNSYRNMKAKRADGLAQIEGLFESAVKNKDIFVNIYYTGHGSDGNWCFNDGVIKLQDIIDIASKYKNYFDQVFKANNEFTAFGVGISSQCCKSGNWCEQLRNYKGKLNCAIVINASSWPGESSWGNKNGSYWTRYEFGHEEQCEKLCKTTSATLQAKMLSKGYTRCYEMTKKKNNDYETTTEEF
eukprot:269958_1